MQELLEYYSHTGDERVGFIQDGEIIEVKNMSGTPENTFQVSPEDLILYGDTAEASWHTHPSFSCNLSPEDYIAITNWPDLRHYIIGNNGIKCFQYNEELDSIVEVSHGNS